MMSWATMCLPRKVSLNFNLKEKTILLVSIIMKINGSLHLLMIKALIIVNITKKMLSINLIYQKSQKVKFSR